ncbi:MAG: hypothetical protein JWL83_4097 [Actinomycetia bacterium]|nr:hypothetical protein [Actinomycetes bacterium]
MAGTYQLRVVQSAAGIQSKSASTWTVSPGGAIADANLAVAVSANETAGGVFPNISPAGFDAFIRFNLEWWLDGAGAATPFASLPSGFKPTSAQVYARPGGQPLPTPTSTYQFQFAQAVESGVLTSGNDPNFPGDNTHYVYPYPTTIPAALKLQTDGCGYHYVCAGGGGLSLLDYIDIRGAYTQVDPTVTGVNPVTGPISGKAVTLTGTNFQSGGVATVTFDGLAATSVVVVDDTTITCVAPANTVGTANIVVTLTGTGPARTGTLAAGFTYVAPAPASLSPSEGSNLGGLAVTITGTYFGSAINAVTIGGVAATSIVRVSETSITCVTPAHALPGAVDVVVTDPNDTNAPGTLVGGFTYIAYFTSAGDADGILPDQKVDPVLHWYTYREAAPGWSAGAEPPKKGWWFTNATTVPAFSSRGNTYVTVNT